MKYDIDNRVKDTAIINLTDFQNAVDLYEDGELEKALELMFGLAVLGFGGDFETNDREIKRLLRNREYTVAKSNEAYCNKVYSTEEKQKAKLQLEEIAELLAEGATQQVIADTLGVNLSTVKYRISIMKEKYPQIYEESIKKSKKSKKGGKSQDNEKDKDKDNVKDKEKEKDNANIKALPFPSSEGKAVSPYGYGDTGYRSWNIYDGVDMERLKNAKTEEEKVRALGF